MVSNLQLPSFRLAIPTFSPGSGGRVASHRGITRRAVRVTGKLRQAGFPPGGNRSSLCLGANTHQLAALDLFESPRNYEGEFHRGGDSPRGGIALASLKSGTNTPVLVPAVVAERVPFGVCARVRATRKSRARERTDSYTQKAETKSREEPSYSIFIVGDPTI